MNNLPNNYENDRNLGWEDFKVNEEYDDSYIRLGIEKIEYQSDIFITYLPGGENLTIDKGRQRRVVMQVNRNGHKAYPTLDSGDGYLVTIYNDDMGTAQMGTKPVRLVEANEHYLVFRGHQVLAMGPFGLIDPGNTDYGFAIFLENKCIKKMVLYRYDTQKCYEYAHTRDRYKQIPINISDKAIGNHNTGLSLDYTNIEYDTVKRNAHNFLKKVASMSRAEQASLARDTDRIFNIGMRYWKNNNQSTALKYFAEALQIYPINTDVIGIYGDYYEYTDYDTSMKFYELAISLKSLRKKDYIQLAYFYEWKGEHDRAARCYALWEVAKMRAGIIDD